jgi:hypothetical protein
MFTFSHCVFFANNSVQRGVNELCCEAESCGECRYPRCKILPLLPKPERVAAGYSSDLDFAR